MTPRRRQLVLVVAAALALLALTVLVAGAPRPPLVEIIPGPPRPVVADPLVASPSALPDPIPEPELEGEPFSLPAWLPQLLRALALGAALLLLAWFLRRLWLARIRVASQNAGTPSGDAVEVDDVDEEELAATVTQTVEHLRRGIPVTGAVIECWRRLERLAADTGIRRHPSQTSQEFTAEVLSRSAVRPAAITELAELYRQAMFSTHALTDADRERAIACLEQLRAHLTESP